MYEKIWHWEPTTITEISERRSARRVTATSFKGNTIRLGVAGFEQEKAAVCLAEGAGTVFCGSA
jgi:hypothetical protein